MFTGKIKIERSVKLINAVEEGKFLLLVNRIVQFLTNGTSKPFTPIEEEKLETSLEISKQEVQCLIDGIVEIFETCIYHMIKPSVLSQQLENLSVSPRKAEILAQIWLGSGKALVDHHKQKPYFPQLSHLSYSVSVQGASFDSSKEKVPKAQLQLGLVSSMNKRKDIDLEFNGEKLYEFYKKLEQIQGQLDAFR